MCLLTDFIDEGSRRFECAIVDPRVSTALSMGKGGATPESVDNFFAGPHFFDETPPIYLLQNVLKGQRRTSRKKGCIRPNRESEESIDEAKKISTNGRNG